MSEQFIIVHRVAHYLMEPTEAHVPVARIVLFEVWNERGAEYFHRWELGARTVLWLDDGSKIDVAETVTEVAGLVSDGGYPPAP